MAFICTIYLMVLSVAAIYCFSQFYHPTILIPDQTKEPNQLIVKKQLWKFLDASWPSKWFLMCTIFVFALGLVLQSYFHLAPLFYKSRENSYEGNAHTPSKIVWQEKSAKLWSIGWVTLGQAFFPTQIGGTARH